MTCPYCKKSIDDDSDFCVHCGKELHETSENEIVHPESISEPTSSPRKIKWYIPAIALIVLIGVIVAVVLNTESKKLKPGDELLLSIELLSEKREENPLSIWSFAYEFYDFVDPILKEAGKTDFSAETWVLDEQGRWTSSARLPVPYTIALTLEDPSDSNSNLLSMEIETKLLTEDETLTLAPVHMMQCLGFAYMDSDVLFAEADSIDTFINWLTQVFTIDMPTKPGQNPLTIRDVTFNIYSDDTGCHLIASRSS